MTCRRSRSKKIRQSYRSTDGFLPHDSPVMYAYCIEQTSKLPVRFQYTYVIDEKHVQQAKPLNKENQSRL